MKTMMRLAIACLVVGLAGGCSAPKSVDIDNLQFLGGQKGAYSGLAYAPNEEKPFTGRAFSLHHNGQKEAEGEFRDGKQHGRWTWWYEDGQMEKEGEYRDGEAFGTWAAWHSNGQKEVEGEFKDGELRGEAAGTWTE